MATFTNCVACDETQGTISMQSSGLVSKMYSDVTGLKAKLSYTICTTCHQDLKSFYNFKKRCHDIASLCETDLESSEITIVKCENGYSPEDKEFDYSEVNPSMGDDDETITNYSVEPSVMQSLESFQDFNDDEIVRPQKFNKINARAEIHFTAAEVNERIFCEGHPPILRLLPKNHVPIPGKTPYSELLCEKVSAIMPNKSPVSVHKGFAIFSETTRAYVKCKHSVKMPASFPQETLQENRPLKIKIVQKCQECVDEAEAQATGPVPSSSFKSQSTFSKYESIFHLPNPVSETFECASKDIHGILNRMYHLCSAEVDPVKKLREHNERIEKEMVQAWRMQVSKAISKDEETKRQSYVKSEEQYDPFRNEKMNEPQRPSRHEQFNVSKRQRR